MVDRPTLTTERPSNWWPSDPSGLAPEFGLGGLVEQISPARDANLARNTSPARRRHMNETASADLPAHDARVLTGDSGRANINLDGQEYILRITRAGKLILTK